jgi:hypothetical protein
VSAGDARDSAVAAVGPIGNPNVDDASAGGRRSGGIAELLSLAAAISRSAAMHRCAFETAAAAWAAGTERTLALRAEIERRDAARVAAFLPVLNAKKARLRTLQAQVTQLQQDVAEARADASAARAAAQAIDRARPGVVAPSDAHFDDSDLAALGGPAYRSSRASDARADIAGAAVPAVKSERLTPGPQIPFPVTAAAAEDDDENGVLIDSSGRDDDEDDAFGWTMPEQEGGVDRRRQREELTSMDALLGLDMRFPAQRRP